MLPFYRGPAEGLWAPLQFDEFMQTKFQERARKAGIETRVNAETNERGTMYHLPEAGTGVYYEKDNSTVRVGLFTTRPANAQRVAEVLMYEAARLKKLKEIARDN